MSESTSSNNVPEPVVRLAAIMSGFRAPWALCGGWAVDAWLGRTTRDHGDVDLSVFVQDQQALYEHLRDWQLLAHDAAWEPSDQEEWWDGRRRLNNPSHIHARPPERRGPMPEGGIARTEDGFELDIQMDERAGDEWMLSPGLMVSLPLRDAVRESPWGLPAAVPEVLLFYKAGGGSGIDWLRRRDRLDFVALLPHLSQKQRRWLRDAVSLLGHPWLAPLSEQGTPAPP